jgi:hypothetical protein
MKSILDKTFHYTPAAQTDIGKRFREIWREQRKAQVAAKLREAANEAEAREKVEPIPTRRQA